MTIKIIQVVVLGLSIIGTILVFYNSPFVDRETIIFTNSETESTEKQDKFKRALAKIGFGLLLLSYLFQTIIIFFDSKI